MKQPKHRTVTPGRSILKPEGSQVFTPIPAPKNLLGLYTKKLLKNVAYYIRNRDALNYELSWRCVTQDDVNDYLACQYEYFAPKAKIQEDEDDLIFAMDPSSLASELGKKFREVLDRAEWDAEVKDEK